ncbi:PepSY domain-containing protein [uncultured Paracoccus sp.]|uniref:PepSY-associated TM helix domain-containing protein n=1 Tax=uncultured Paracoccus sp. TaxID=189685 RepID=UPI00261B6C2D|nr:PepSY domain-containing protein [uncultured Paracoccus sp.]
MTDIPRRTTVPKAEPAASNTYFIAWRWHFYAGLYVIPFMTMLALTGLMMLWISWSTGIGGERLALTPSGDLLPASTLQATAEAAVPGATAFHYLEPLADDRAAIVAVAVDGVKTGVALDPYSGEVLRSFDWQAGWYDWLSVIHGTLMLGVTGDRMIEIAASLGLIMIATGIYLHWPRGQSGWRGALLPRLSARGRSWWKSLHGVLGFWVSALLVVFLISGLSWSGIWGEKFVQAWNTFPVEKYAPPPSEAVAATDNAAPEMMHDMPMSDDVHAKMNHGAEKEVPWTLEQAPMPASGSLAGTAAIAGAPDLDSVVAFARGLGFDGRFQIALPDGPEGVWTVSHDSASNDGPGAGTDRTLHLDRYTGNVLADIRYADYSPYAKAMAWGVAFHEGDLGVWNLVLNTLFCLSVVFLTVSGLVMWWKRRPDRAGRLAAPPRSPDHSLWKGAAVLVVILSALFPLAGAAIVAAWLLDLTLLRLMPGLKRAVS